MEGDKVVVKDGLRMFLPAESRLFLQGATVDFADTAMSTGFVIQSPMAPSGPCSTDHKPEPVQLVSLGKLG
jgi:Fe-S cluster assembly iron-binding protein IscA